MYLYTNTHGVMCQQKAICVRLAVRIKVGLRLQRLTDWQKPLDARWRNALQHAAYTSVQLVSYILQV